MKTLIQLGAITLTLVLAATVFVVISAPVGAPTFFVVVGSPGTELEFAL